MAACPLLKWHHKIIEATEGLDDSTIPHPPFMDAAPAGRQNQTVFDADSLDYDGKYGWRCFFPYDWYNLFPSYMIVFLKNYRTSTIDTKREIC